MAYHELQSALLIHYFPGIMQSGSMQFTLGHEIFKLFF